MNFAGKQNCIPEKFYICYLHLQIVISCQHRLIWNIGDITLRPKSPESKAKSQSCDDLEIYQLTGSESGNGPEMTLNFINRKKKFQIKTRNNKSFLLNFSNFLYIYPPDNLNWHFNNKRFKYSRLFEFSFFRDLLRPEFTAINFPIYVRFQNLDGYREIIIKKTNK